MPMRIEEGAELWRPSAETVEAAHVLRPVLAETLVGRRDDGVHSVGEIWRRNRLTCPTRTDLGSWLLGSLEDDHADYIDFHIRTVGCRICVANLTDLENAVHPNDDTSRRRQRYFQSSAGHLPKAE